MCVCVNNTLAGLPTRLWAERMENRVSISARDRFPSFPKCPDWLWGSFHGDEAAVVCSGELACTKVKNAWSYTSILTFAFMGRCLIKRTDSCIFCQYITF